MESVVKSLHEAAQNGCWLILKNLHLMTSWLPLLEKEFRSMNKIHNNFRLWFTSEPHPNMSSAWIQLCLKITYEVNATPLRQIIQNNLDSNVEFFDRHRKESNII